MRASIVFWAIGFTLYLLITYFPPEALQAFDTWSLGQSIAAPFLLLALGCLNISGRRLPRVLVLLLALMLITASARYYSPAGSFAAARLSNDPFEVLGRSVRESSGPLTRVFRSFSDSRAAQRYLESHAMLRALTWGDERLLRVSFSTRLAGELFPELVTEQLRQDTGLRLVTELPEIALSPTTDPGTARFLNNLFAGLEAAHSVAGNLAFHSAQELGFVSNLTAAAYVSAHWKSVDHLALPWWILGNYYLLQAQSSNSSSMQRALLNCAAQYYARARKALRPSPGANGYRELLAATFNNQAVTGALLYRLSGEKKILPRMRAYLKAARHLLDTQTLHAGLNKPALIARENVRSLRELRKSKSLVRAGGARKFSKKHSQGKHKKMRKR